MAWKRYRTATGAHVTLNYEAPDLTELPTDPPLDINGKPRPPAYPEHIELNPEKEEENHDSDRS